MENSPLRTYFLSDTFGGQEEWNPHALPDPDVMISTDFGSRPDQPVHREFDIFGQEEVSAHILRLVLAKHDELSTRLDLRGEKRQRAIEGGTGVFINSAPRIERTNAEPFYLATARGGRVRIVSTPLSALSAVKGEIETLQYLHNPTKLDETNGLYTGSEQFRSQYTPILLDPNHGLALENADPAMIPDARNDWHISYVDRFGNVITRIENAEAQWQEILRVASEVDGSRDRVRLLLGKGSDAQPTPPLELTKSLGAATPGVASVYRNSGGIDVVVKWMPHQSASSRLASSAWQELGKPAIGTPIAVSHANL